MTGAVLEDTVLPALKRNGYTYSSQVYIGPSVSGGRHIVDVIAVQPGGSEALISVKYQQTSGTAEEKVPYEVIKLIHAIKNSEGRFTRAYIILAGTRWSKRVFYLSGALADYIIGYELVKIITLDDFLALANRKTL
jgi:hypothetical protein